MNLPLLISAIQEWRQVWVMLTGTVTGTFYCHFIFRVIYISIGPLTKTPYVLYKSSLLGTGFGKDWLRFVFGGMTGGQGEGWKEVGGDERELKVLSGDDDRGTIGIQGEGWLCGDGQGRTEWWSLWVETQDGGTSRWALNVNLSEKVI